MMTTDTDSGSTPQSPTEPLYIDGKDHLDDVVTEHDVVLVDFFADWCGPCKMLEPVLDDLASATDATIAKVDVDQHQQLAGAYGVRGVPTLVLFADGEQVEQHTGALPADRLQTLVENYSE
ncbi:thioredoxin (plasmid) [Natrialba magadii ATCC 43099]|uniref:Thioredoxin n=2 Tax=Natrialba magadii (strain ATCC 43099 / DSM 3394 / CCM 3739 / CIP 104546 / IAM 13178 / JCM 8861 / NBRC 102185 / NCIMB 2190 / MS3) TaxID=547559 RepID=D3T0S9_NATMM|nr:thioredoxin [Natrialba magadii ATCC 43099]